MSPEDKEAVQILLTVKFDTLSEKELGFLEDISENDPVLTPKQAAWLNRIWEREMLHGGRC